MSTKKKVAAIVITTIALTAGTVGVSSASSKSTTTRVSVAQASNNGIKGPRAEVAAIAGAKKDALITALVADETKRIDAAVTAGKLTAAQATTLKSTLTARVTTQVNAVRPMGPKGGDKGDRGHSGPKGGSKGSHTLTLPAPAKA